MRDKMKVELKVKPFQVPNFALLEVPSSLAESERELPSVPLSALSVDALDDLCDTFRRDVFTKAKKRDPGRVVAALDQGPTP